MYNISVKDLPKQKNEKKKRRFTLKNYFPMDFLSNTKKQQQESLRREK